MSMGLVNDEDFECELNKGSQSNWNKATSIDSAKIIESPNKGRALGDVEVPESLRKIIGETSELDGRKEAVALAKMFDISESSVSAYAHGSTSTSTYNQSKTEPGSINEHINKSKERISNKARSRLFQSLKYITDEKLKKEESVAILSQVARNMATIVKEMEPLVNTNNENNGIQFIFYSPHIKTEEVYDTITVNE